ncbi:maleylacetoacetate isomerase [Sphingomonas sp. AR_OL41]|uniref:maleylacetoacetate isomerase n=1 Tax=Sphingomonas sp. AR_OL41 TaxID=3042729 RepID=UPI00247FA62B|nr:maleylacetoacetate isomerase [Sphingomonas sp. AR_OL41]MDH7975406.1 maleylacetoacetate isomerase [Sphingomonas sp. AR_OL41]
MTLRLYGYWRSSAAYRVRIALALKGVAYDSVEVNLAAGEQRGAAFRARNPQGLVPALEVDGIMIGQSLAIIDYLDATWPEPPFVPRDALARAQVLAQALVIAADIHPIDNLRVLNRLGEQFGADQAAKDVWYRHWISEGFDALEKTAGDGLFLGGAAPNLADICLIPQMYNARRLALPLDAWPRLVAADAAGQALPAIAAVHPDRVKPA